MPSLRVVFVTRRFWPLVGSAEKAVAALAAGARRRGAVPTILTARWDPDWPAKAWYDGIPVVRLPIPWGRGWGTVRYMIALSRWLRRHQSHVDVVCVSRLRLGAWTAVRAMARTGIPVVLRAESAGPFGDCHWQQRSRFAAAIGQRCREAAAIVAPDMAVARELARAGYAPDRIHVIANGVEAMPAGNGAKRFEARAALARVNEDLAVAIDAPVALYVGRLRKGKNLVELVRAWRSVVQRWPMARLWLVGDGPLRDALHREIADCDLARCVLMPGTFDEVDEIFRAANLFVCPSAEPGLPQALLEAIGAGVPVVAADTEDLRRHPGIGGAHVERVPPGQVRALGKAMIHMLEHPPGREILARARRGILQRHSTVSMVKKHLELFEHAVRSGTG